MRPSVSLLGVAAITLASASAVAQTRNEPPRADRVAPVNVSGSLLMGGSNGGAVLGVTVLTRIGTFDVGAEGILAVTLFDYSYGGLAGDAGVAWQSTSGFRLDAFGALGVHGYGGVGRGFLSSDPGASATLPFAGARLLAGYVFGEGPAHFELGLLGFCDDDLTRKTVSYDYVEHGLFGGGGGPDFVEHATHTVGTSRVGAALTLTFSYDYW